MRGQPVTPADVEQILTAATSARAICHACRGRKNFDGGNNARTTCHACRSRTNFDGGNFCADNLFTPAEVEKIFDGGGFCNIENNLRVIT